MTTQPLEAAPAARAAEAQHPRQVCDDPAVVCQALRTVLLHCLSAPFDLRAEEVLWARYHLEHILAPLAHVTPSALPVAVRQELLGADSGRALLPHDQQREVPDAPFDPDVASATLEDWAATLMALITQCYQLRPLVQSQVHAQIVALLRELGLGDASGPRAARFLPADVRHRVLVRRAAEH